MSITAFRCLECGKECQPNEFHDHIECVRYRWADDRARDGGSPSVFEMNTAEADIKALLAYIDHANPAPRSYAR